MALTRLEIDGAEPIWIDGALVAEPPRAGADAAADVRRLEAAGPGVVVRPGEVNAHTHLYSGLAPLGMPAPAEPPQSFLEILERVWWRLDRALDEASLRAAARLYIAEALLAGTTTLVDHHESPRFIEGSLDVLAGAAEELGARLVVCYGATERNDGLAEARRGLAECARFVRENRRPLVRGMIGLHASFTVSDETIHEAGELARELSVPVHVHVAEDMADVVDAKTRGHEGPLERLLALDALPRGSILAHGVWLKEPEVKKTEALAHWLVQNPRSNEHNRVGYPRAIGASLRVAIGTDGFAADMRAEHEALARLAREHSDPAGSDEQLLARTKGGFRLAAEWFAGTFIPPVAPGSAADLVIEDDSAGAEGRPRHVLAGGRVVVENGRLVTGDIDEIRARAREEAGRLWRRMEET